VASHDLVGFGARNVTATGTRGGVWPGLTSRHSLARSEGCRDSWPHAALSAEGMPPTARKFGSSTLHEQGKNTHGGEGGRRHPAR
jgi:hypothetical protein